MLLHNGRYKIDRRPWIDRETMWRSDTENFESVYPGRDDMPETVMKFKSK